MKLSDKNLYYIGGVVRDEFLGAKSFDVDLCYEGNAIEFAKNNNLKIIKENPAFGTVRVLNDDKEIDIASTRCETYPRKGHLPKVEKIGCSLKEDLIRRDFTINAMAKRTTDGEIIDFFEGQKDIKDKCLRVLHKNSFIDDPTRIIRGLKFSVRFGFELSEETKKLQEEYLEKINYDMSYHRVKKELTETFMLNKKEAYKKFVDQKIYKLLGENQTVPDFNSDIAQRLLENNPTEHCWLIWLSGFDLSKLELTRAEKRILEWAEKLKTQSPSNNTPKESVIISKIRRGEC